MKKQEIKDLLSKLLSAIDFIFDDNGGSVEVVIGDVILEDTNENLVIRLHKK